jgi:hypothetical protein
MIRTMKALLCATLLASATVASAQTDSARQGIAYASVADALAALRAKAGVTFAKNADWTIANDTDRSIWSFTPEGHYAHPSVGRRTLVAHQGGYFVKTEILCQAEKPACDKLYADYQLLDRRMNEAIRAGK